MDIPTKFINKTYLELFISFYERVIIVLVLYLLPGSRDNNHPYKYIKPNPKTILTQRDKIFFLKANYDNYYVFDKEDDNIKILNTNSNTFTRNNRNDGSLNIHNTLKNHENFTRGMIIENGITQKKYIPFQFIEDALDDIEKCVEDNKQTILDAKKIHKKVLIKVLNIQFDKIFNINIYIYILPKNNFSLFNSLFLYIIL